jgi:hypothetical protein
MSHPRRRRTAFPRALVGLLLVAALTACGASLAPSLAPSQRIAAPSLDGFDVAARGAYQAAMCPIFNAILAIDPRLKDLREAGAAGGDVSAQAGEVDAVIAELLITLNDLDDVPAWSFGDELRFSLTNALHAIRTHLLAVAEDPSHGTAAETLAATPYIATEAMDRSMARAVEAGLSCEVTE